MNVCMRVHLQAMKNRLKPELSIKQLLLLFSLFSYVHMALAINVTDRHGLSNKSYFVEGYQDNGVFAVRGLEFLT